MSLLETYVKMKYLQIATSYTLTDARVKERAAIELLGMGEFDMYLKGNDVAEVTGKYDGEMVFPGNRGVLIEKIYTKYLDVVCDGEVIRVDPGHDFEIDFRI